MAAGFRDCDGELARRGSGVPGHGRAKPKLTLSMATSRNEVLTGELCL